MPSKGIVRVAPGLGPAFKLLNHFFLVFMCQVLSSLQEPVNWTPDPIFSALPIYFHLLRPTSFLESSKALEKGDVSILASPILPVASGPWPLLLGISKAAPSVGF